MPRTPFAAAPIGVFDSGLGGLTVAGEIMRRLPRERILYVADQAHVPYGGRDLSEVRAFAVGISASLINAGCKAVVMACNISSAIALETVQAQHPDVPILGVIHAGASAAASATDSGIVGVLATAGTVQSGAYTRTLHALNPALRVLEVACPQFVPLVEGGQEGSERAQQAACDYLSPLLAANVDTVILGCTHYPYLLPVLRSAAENLRYINPAQHTVARLQSLLETRGLLAEGQPEAQVLLTARQSETQLSLAARQSEPHLLCTTGDADAFAAQLRRFLPDAAPFTVRAADWNAGRLHLPLPVSA